MTKGAIINGGNLEPLSEVPRDSVLIVDFGPDPLDPDRLHAWESAGHDIRAALVRPESLASPLLERLSETNVPVIVIPTRLPAIGEALASAARLAQPHVAVEMHLRAESDLNVLKILSTLGVRTRIPLSLLASAGTTLLDAMMDALLRPGKRSPVTPFEEIRLGIRDDNFEIASLDYIGNDHFVDLRAPGATCPSEGWQSPAVPGKRIPFLESRHFCAFCEGLLFCHGYLYAPETAPFCKALFSEMMECIALSIPEPSASRKTGSGPGERSGPPCGCDAAEKPC